MHSLGEVHPVSEQNKSLISDTVYIILDSVFEIKGDRGRQF